MKGWMHVCQLLLHGSPYNVLHLCLTYCMACGEYADMCVLAAGATGVG